MILTLLQSVGDTLAPLVPLIISVATPFVVKYTTDLVVWLFPKLYGWGVVIIVVPILGGAVTAVTNLLTSAGPSWYVQLGLGLLAVFVNEVYKQIKQGKAPVTANVVKTIALILVLGLASTARAQTFDNFTQPRPPIATRFSPSDGQIVPAAPASIFEFKLAVTMAATSFTPSLLANRPWTTALVAGAGPGFMLQKSRQVNGVNYALYSGTLSTIFSGGSFTDPKFQASLALMVAGWNNVISAGVKWALYRPDGDMSRISILIGTQVNLFNN